MAVLMVSCSALASDKYVHDDSVLPAAAKSVIKKNFKAKVSLVKIDREWGSVSEYDVILDDGSEISFDSKGNWKDVETNANRSVPAGFIPAGVQKYVSQNHKGVNIVGIEKDRHGYDVELANGVDIKFDQAGNFKKYD